MDEGRFRRKIGWFQLCCCIMVIWSHSGNAELFLGRLEQTHPLMRLEYRIFPAVIRISIPCFFMMSGYQFYRGFAMGRLWGKWKRRVKTLLIPYLAWNLLYYLGYQAANLSPFLREIVNKPELGFSLAELVEAVVFYRYNPLFWFMYQLILLVFLAPVFYLFLSRIWSGLVFLAAVLAVVFFLPSSLPVNPDAMFYYCTAGFLALHGQRAAEAGWTWRRALAGAALMALGITISGLYYARGIVPAIVAYHVMAVMGLWLMAGDGWQKGWKPWMESTFFIYAFHFIPVRFLNKTMARLFPGSETAAWLLYLGMPFFAVTACRGAASLLKHVPWLWETLSGGRGSRGEGWRAGGKIYFS